MSKNNYENVKRWREKQGDRLRLIRAEEARRWRAKHPDVAKAIQDRWRANNLEKDRKQDNTRHKKWRQKYPEKWKQLLEIRRIKKLEKLEKEAGRSRPKNCELCGDETKVVYDHNHESNKFRGWICDRCNRVLGSVKDNIKLLKKMIDYLKKDGE